MQLSSHYLKVETGRWIRKEKEMFTNKSQKFTRLKNVEKIVKLENQSMLGKYDSSDRSVLVDGHHGCEKKKSQYQLYGNRAIVYWSTLLH